MVDIDEIGIHSNRKGQQSQALNGSTAGPNTATVYLRSGQKLGQPNQRYIFQQPAGDAYLGRISTGLDVNSVDFMVLPPHFKSLTPELLSVIQSVIPQHDRYPQSFSTTFPYLIASVVFHVEYLNTTLPRTHPLFRSMLFRDLKYRDLMPHVVAGLQYCPHSGMRATGIPPHVLLMGRLDKVEETMRSNTAAISRLTESVDNIKHALVGSSSVGGVSVVDLNTSLRDALQSFTTQMARDCKAMTEAAQRDTAHLIAESLSRLSVVSEGRRGSSATSGEDNTALGDSSGSAAPDTAVRNAFAVITEGRDRMKKQEAERRKASLVPFPVRWASMCTHVPVREYVC